MNYNGFMLRYHNNLVKVYRPDCFLNPLYVATSLNRAMRWVDAYQKGEQWALDVKLAATVG